MRGIDLKMLPDGSGKVRIHWFVRDPVGPLTVNCLHPAEEKGKVVVRPTKGRLACQPDRASVQPEKLPDGYTQLTPHSDDVYGATCPECLATQEAITALQTRASATT